MTWSKFDDAAAKSPKALVAGNEAWSLWAAAIMYCNRHSTDGYVSLAALATECLPVPIGMQKAKRLAELLCASRARPDGAGLFEEAGSQLFRVHDFLDWNPSKVEVEAKRKADRDRKRRGPDSDRDSGTIPRGSPQGKPPDSVAPRASARALPAPPRPDPTSPTQSESGASATTPKRVQRMRRFPDFEPAPEHVNLAMQIGADLAAELAKFRDYEFRDPKSDANACFRSWLRRSIELKRGEVRTRIAGDNRAADGLEQQRLRAQGLRALESVPNSPPKALP